jgi:hypothetical protein
MKREKIQGKTAEWIKENVTPLTERQKEKIFDDMLDDCHQAVNLGYHTFRSSEIIKKLDPIAYRCDMADHFDSIGIEEIDGEEYLTSDIETAISCCTDEDEEEGE